MPRYDNITELEASLDGKSLRIGIVMSRFNQDVCEGLLSACTEELINLGVAASAIRIATVPGALEIPLTLQVMARSGRFDALIALGAVIRGETYHFEIVANEMAAGVNRVGLDTAMPIANGVLTTEDDDQALVAMTIDAVDIARDAAVDEVVIAGDLTSALPLVHRLHAAGVRVVAVGAAHTPHDVRAACHEFIDTGAIAGDQGILPGRHRA